MGFGRVHRPAALVSVTIPAGSEWGGGNAQFYGCDSLETVYIEEGVAQIPATFLNGCGSLEYVWVPKSVTEFVGMPIWVAASSGTRAPLPRSTRTGGRKSALTWSISTPSTATSTPTENGRLGGRAHVHGERRADSHLRICGAEQSQELAATGHIWDGGVVTKEPTESAEGVRTYTCAACGQTKTEPIAKLPQTGGDKPQGGDRPDGSAGGCERGLRSGRREDELPQTGDGTFARSSVCPLLLCYLFRRA